MKLCTFEFNGPERVGIVMQKDKIADITVAYAALLHNRGETRAIKLAEALAPPSMVELIEGGATSLTALKEIMKFMGSSLKAVGPKGERIFYSLEEVRLKAPIPRPPKILGPNWNQKKDQERVIRPPGEPHPFYAIKLGTSVTGPFDPIEIPDIGSVNSEVEAAVVIGKRGKNIPLENAEDYIFGCTIINDVTAGDMRDNQAWLIIKRPNGEQARFSTAARYKCFDTFCPMGPWIVTCDEIDIHNCHMEARIGDTLDQIGTTADMFFNFFQLISYFSEAHTLEPGDIISSGTVPLAPDRKIKNLGKVDLNKAEGILVSEIKEIGTIKNPIKHI